MKVINLDVKRLFDSFLIPLWYCDASGKHITGHDSDLSDIYFGERGLKLNVVRINFGYGTKNVLEKNNIQSFTSSYKLDQVDQKS